MSRVPSKKAPKEQLPDSSKVVFVTMADTSWRMFVPSIGCTFLGLWLDSKWHTSPWLLFTGIIVGLLLAAFAVMLQYKKLM